MQKKNIHSILSILVLSCLLLLTGCKEDFVPDKNLTTDQSAQKTKTAVSSADTSTQSKESGSEKQAEAASAQTQKEEMAKQVPEPMPEIGPEPELAPYCGDGKCLGEENCANCYEDCACESPAECHNGVCKIPECGSDNDCEDEDPCTEDICYFAQHPNAYCAHEPKTKCRSDDGCCPKNCNADTDTDCPAVCGNDVCEPGETTDNCYKDCGPVCGNQDCEFKEDHDNCPHDCCEPDKWMQDGSTCNCAEGYKRVTDPGFYMCTKS